MNHYSGCCLKSLPSVEGTGRALQRRSGRRAIFWNEITYVVKDCSMVVKDFSDSKAIAMTVSAREAWTSSWREAIAWVPAVTGHGNHVLHNFAKCNKHKCQKLIVVIPFQSILLFHRGTPKQNVVIAMVFARPESDINTDTLGVILTKPSKTVENWLGTRSRTAAFNAMLSLRMFNKNILQLVLSCLKVRQISRVLAKRKGKRQKTIHSIESWTNRKTWKLKTAKKKTCSSSGIFAYAWKFRRYAEYEYGCRHSFSQTFPVFQILFIHEIFTSCMLPWVKK